jgi:predicted amidophosphoribosyltransferase
MTKQTPPLAYPNATQQDFAAGADLHCPTCGKPWGKVAIRVCRNCGKPIGRSEKWRHVPAGPGLVAIEHRDQCIE